MHAMYGEPGTKWEEEPLADWTPIKTSIGLHDHTAGTEAPKYVAFWVPEEKLGLLAASLSDSAKDLFPLVPSSTILLEVTEDK